MADLLNSYAPPSRVSSSSSAAGGGGGTAAFCVTRLADAVPDNRAKISAELRRLSSPDEAFHLVVTTGGTGLAPRDVTPEATLAVCERAAPGIAHLMMSESLKHTPMAAASRMAAGVRGRTLIVNLPGKPKAATEILPALMPVLYHACRVVAGDTEHADVARSRGSE